MRRLRQEDYLSPEVLIYSALCWSEVLNKFSFNMMTSWKQGPTRLPKKGWIGPAWRYSFLKKNICEISHVPTAGLDLTIQNKGASILGQFSCACPLSDDITNIRHQFYYFILVSRNELESIVWKLFYYCVVLFLGNMNKLLLTLNRGTYDKPMWRYHWNIVWWTMSLIRVPYRNMAEQFLIGREITER